MIKRALFALAALLLVSGCSQERLPEDDLRIARQKLEHHLLEDENLTQSEMTILSEYMLKLAGMEEYLIEYRIWNRPGYDKIEKAFREDCERWRKLAVAESEKPSEYAGGSLEPMDHNMRMVGFFQQRIDELKTKWLSKL